MKVLTVTEVAAILRVAEQQVRKMCAKKELPAKKVGREWRIADGALEKWMGVAK